MKMTPEEVKLIERVKKLHAMAESAREVGSLAEADSFMEAVNKTLAKHNLDSSVLSLDMRNITDPLTYVCVTGSTRRHRNKPVGWARTLAGAVATAHYCDELVGTKSSHVWFYGRKSNVDVAVKMFVYLRDMAERLGWREYQKYCRQSRLVYGKAVGANTYYLDWLEGFAYEVGRRYRTMRARLDSNSTMALVLTGVLVEARDYAKAHISKKKDDDEIEVWTGDGHAVARALGAMAAQQANLRPNSLEDDKPTTRKMLK